MNVLFGMVNDFYCHTHFYILATYLLSSSQFIALNSNKGLKLLSQPNSLFSFALPTGAKRTYVRFSAGF
ncbi:hypothetical protein [Paraglaciecola polaris]|uniref:Uncharacterized protein n=1 Tax=Paraglaciecola polaris LMG 21857 TaxID=1129793 RepID=K6ZUQ6_9ALTE|nr:hypothetical protein [Paraglaciecola polaris]GAC34012.1 hypothetical protein GPLA_3121 [Paraglaciecola polaris LMG 21857]